MIQEYTSMYTILISLYKNTISKYYDCRKSKHEDNNKILPKTKFKVILSDIIQIIDITFYDVYWVSDE